MALVNRFPLTINGDDIIGGISTSNSGYVSFSPLNGASFDGTTRQSLQFFKNLNSSVDPFTLSIWLKFYNTTQTCVPFGSGVSGSNYSRCGFIYQGNIPRTGALFYNGTPALKDGDFIPSNYPSTSFVLCVITYDLNTLSIFRNNILLNSATVTPMNLSTQFAIGCEGGSVSSYFKGNALDARIYNHALTTTEISDLLSVGANGGSSTQQQQCIGGF